MADYDIVNISTTFNKSIKNLINIMNESIHNNVMFDTIKRRVKIVIDTNPLLLLQEGGVYIFKYRDYIKNDQLDDLLLNPSSILNDNAEIKEYIDNNESDSNNINMLLNLLKDIWVNYDKSEKKIIKKNIKILLSEYCKYLSTTNN